MTKQEAMIRLDFIRCALLGGTKPEIIPNEDNVELMDNAIKAFEEVEQYRAIGTPEECREAVEKQKAKKPIIKYKQTQDCVTEVEWKCPICGTNYVELAPCGEWCRYCGTKLDWR